MDPKKPIIYPSQLIQELVKYNDWGQHNSIRLNYMEFKELEAKIESMYEVDFDYFELIHYAKRFKNPMIIVEETEISLHKNCSEMLLQHLEWYNRMYQSNDQIVSGAISRIWKTMK